MLPFGSSGSSFGSIAHRSVLVGFRRRRRQSKKWLAIVESEVRQLEFTMFPPCVACPAGTNVLAAVVLANSLQVQNFVVFRPPSTWMNNLANQDALGILAFEFSPFGVCVFQHELVKIFDLNGYSFFTANGSPKRSSYGEGCPPQRGTTMCIKHQCRAA